MTAPFFLSGTEQQRQVCRDALARCDFPFDRLMPSLIKEGRQSIRVEWADLSRYAASDGLGHDHVHDDDAVAHPIERVVEGRRRVLGLFYLPPHTRILLDNSLLGMPELAGEVLLAEAAHAVDYHYMTPDMRRAFVNSVHTQQLAPGADVGDGVAFALDGHICSWFDVGSYADWVGEAFMEGFIEAFAPSQSVTISLNHPVGPEDRAVIRVALAVDEPAKEDVQPAPVVGPAAPVAEEVFTVRSGVIYHDKHLRLRRDLTFPSPAAAQAEGFRPCRVCKPGR